MIVYQALEGISRDNFGDYVNRLRSRFAGIQNVVFVGGSHYDISVPDASRLATTLEDRPFYLGGITIPERHRDKGNEHTRVFEKSESGVSFFTSQVVYNADIAIWMLKDYHELCKSRHVQPARIIWAFAPFGRDHTLKFLRWLGVEVPEGTAQRILSRPSIPECVEMANDVCVENLKRILAACRHYNIQLPMGIAVESVSKYRDEQEGAEKLFETLRNVMHEHTRWLTLSSSAPLPLSASTSSLSTVLTSHSNGGGNNNNSNHKIGHVNISSSNPLSHELIHERTHSQ